MTEEEVSKVAFRGGEMLGQSSNTESRLRIGQSLFQALEEICPEKANLIRGTAIDPYYKEDKDFDISSFWDILYTL